MHCTYKKLLLSLGLYFLSSFSCSAALTSKDFVADIVKQAKENIIMQRIDASLLSFAAPLSTVSCSDIHSQALSCGSVSAVSAVDCGSFVNHPGTSTDLLLNYFTDTTVPYYTIDTSVIYTNSTTTYESTNTNNPATSITHLFEQQYMSAGEIYVRNVY